MTTVRVTTRTGGTGTSPSGLAALPQSREAQYKDLLANVPEPDLETPFYKAWKRRQAEQQREWQQRNQGEQVEQPAPVPEQRSAPEPRAVAEPSASQLSPAEQALADLMRLLGR